MLWFRSHFISNLLFLSTQRPLQVLEVNKNPS